MKRKWGVILFLAALAAAYTSLWMTSPEGSLGALKEQLPLWMWTAGLLCLVLAYVSYFRVQEYLTFIWGHFLFWFSALYVFIRFKMPSVDIPFPKQEESFIRLYLCLMGDYFLLCLLPSGLSYSTVKRLTYGLVLLQTVWVWWPWGPGLEAILYQGKLLHPVYVYLSLGGLAVLWGLCVLRLHRASLLTGALAGSGALFTAAWLSPHFFKNPESVRLLLLLAALWHGVLAVGWHWIATMGQKVAMDPLLKIYNRAFCQGVLAGRSGVNISAPLTLAMIDIDHFKKVNDRYGHHAGDEVLYNVAQTIESVLNRKAVVCRYGGEELTAFFPKTPVEKAQPLLEKVRRAVQARRVKSGKRQIQVTISIGVAQKRRSSDSLDAVMQVADKALYRAKKGGRNQVKVGKLSGKK